jgi:hypothetical protein
VPTDNYDVVVKQVFEDLDGNDVVLSTDLAGGVLANRDDTNTEYVEIWPTVKQNGGKLRIEVSNAGNITEGRITLVVYRTLAISTTGGGTGIPIGGAATQMLQWTSSGQAKWITLSGDATVADGGAVTVADDSHSHGDSTVSDTLTIGSSSTVADAALSAQVAHLNVAETIAANWVNTANPWADNEVVDDLTISGGIVDNTPIGATTPSTGAFTTLTVAPDTDASSSLGRLAVGSPVTDIMYIAHYDRMTSANYALRQSGAGLTVLNGSLVNVSIGNSTALAIDGSLNGTFAGDLQVNGNDVGFGDGGGFSGFKFDPTGTEIEVWIDGSQIGSFHTDGSYNDDV